MMERDQISLFCHHLKICQNVEISQIFDELSSFTNGEQFSGQPKKKKMKIEGENVYLFLE